ncbi:2TM domain-containing protein [Abyssalbus ytuae]|uniref:2TM domain-containing protein n=1 Tax=Abyssalbus ytuae TaxID=2926907 RepID=A0A9E6ZKA0_9FLAO|nr:2TM domain-containing protein [Abyssalbus ytuae]UOB17219.1 2TM domain-containing protein [Abyssalbus ytuae]
MTKNLFKIIKISVLITLIIEVFDLIFFAHSPTVKGEMEDTAVNFLFAFPLTLVNAYFIDFIGKKYSWEKQPQKRLWIGTTGGIALTMFTLLLIRFVLLVFIYGKPAERFFEEERIQYYGFGLVMTIIFSLFFHAFYFYKALQDKKVKEQKVIAGTATAQFDALKNQLDPHFLFNSLNVLTSLIEENPDQAQKFTTSLSKVYRYVLEQKNKELVSVEEELQFAKTYMSLLKKRFENSIVFDIPEQYLNPEAKVVPLSLQLLLENAVKHNMVNEANPLHIKIYEENGNLLIKNNLQPKQVLKKSSGVGLQNIKQRYNLLTNRKVEIRKTQTDFIVKIPILTKRATIMRTQAVKTNDKYLRARKRVDDLKEFYSSLIMYPIVIPFLIFINYKTYWGFKWFWFPLIGWGIGLLFHAYKVYAVNGILGRDWEDKKIRKYMEEEAGTNRWE